MLLQPPSDVAQDGGGSTAFVCAAGETVFWAVLVAANPGSTFEIGPARFSTFAYSQCADVEVDCPSDANDANLDIGRPSGPAGVEIAPTQLRFGAQPFASLARQTFILTNRSSRTLNVTIDSMVMPDDFSPGQPESTCPLAGITVSLLLPGQSCSHTVVFQPDPSFDQPESALMSIVSKDLTGKVVQDRLLRLSGRGVDGAS